MSILYRKSSKRPHTVIKNIISELLKKENKFYYEILLLNNLKKCVKNINYFSLSYIDLIILRFFILRELSSKDSFTINDIKCKNNICSAFSYKINRILTHKGDTKYKKEYILKLFHRQISLKGNDKIFLELENKKDEDIVLLLKYLKIR